MNDFKVGDPVEYVGPSREIQELSPFVITGFYGSGESQYVKIRGADRWEPLVKNLRPFNPTPDPDVLTIPRAELPEVVERQGALWADGLQYGFSLPAATHRSHALAQLAASEFLAAREKAEQDAADQHAAILNKRRDELAVELFDQPGYKAHPEPFNYYADATPVVRAAIDRIIQLESAVKK